MRLGSCWTWGSLLIGGHLLRRGFAGRGQLNRYQIAVPKATRHRALPILTDVTNHSLAVKVTYIFLVGKVESPCFSWSGHAVFFQQLMHEFCHYAWLGWKWPPAAGLVAFAEVRFARSEKKSRFDWLWSQKYRKRLVVWEKVGWLLSGVAKRTPEKDTVWRILLIFQVEVADALAHWKKSNFLRAKYWQQHKNKESKLKTMERNSPFHWFSSFLDWQSLLSFK